MLVRPELIKRSYYPGRPLFFVRTVSGILTSRPTASEGLQLFEAQWEVWNAALQVTASEQSMEPNTHVSAVNDQTAGLVGAPAGHGRRLGMDGSSREMARIDDRDRSAACPPKSNDGGLLSIEAIATRPRATHKEGPSRAANTVTAQGDR